MGFLLLLLFFFSIIILGWSWGGGNYIFRLEILGVSFQPIYELVNKNASFVYDLGKFVAKVIGLKSP